METRAHIVTAISSSLASVDGGGQTGGRCVQKRAKRAPLPLGSYGRCLSSLQLVPSNPPGGPVPARTRANWPHKAESWVTISPPREVFGARWRRARACGGLLCREGDHLADAGARTHSLLPGARALALPSSTHSPCGCGGGRAPPGQVADVRQSWWCVGRRRERRAGRKERRAGRKERRAGRGGFFGLERESLNLRPSPVSPSHLLLTRPASP